MHGSGSPSAMFIVAKRQLSGPDMVSGAGPGWEEARRDAVHAAQAEEAPGPCPSDGPDRPDHHGASETAELIRTGEGTECPVCRTRTGSTMRAGPRPACPTVRASTASMPEDQMALS